MRVFRRVCVPRAGGSRAAASFGSSLGLGTFFVVAPLDGFRGEDMMRILWFYGKAEVRGRKRSRLWWLRRNYFSVDCQDFILNTY